MNINKLNNNRFIKNVIRVFYPYGSIRKIIRSELKGQKIVCSPSMAFSYIIGLEIKRMQFLKKHISAGDMVLDIGANCGQISLFLSHLVGQNGVVHSFEPLDYPFSLLKKNINLNSIKNIKFHNLAVSNKKGEENFIMKDELSNGGVVESKYNINSNKKTLTIDSISIDEFCSIHNIKPTFIKIDVEGAAHKVLEGAIKTIIEFKPLIYIEMHLVEEQIAVKEILQGNNYKLKTINGLEIDDPTVGWNDHYICYQ